MTQKTDSIGADFGAKFQAAKTPQERAAVIAECEAAHAASKSPAQGVAPAEAQPASHFMARYTAAKTADARNQVLADLSAAHAAGKLAEEAE